MKRLFTLILTFALAGTLQAKAGTAENEKKAKSDTQKVTKLLSLSKDQQDKMYAVALDFYNQNQSINKNQSGAEKQKAIHALRENTEAKVKAILTAEQFTKWKTTREQKHTQKAQTNKASGK